MPDRRDVPALLRRAATALEIRDVERERADECEYLRALADAVQRWQEAEAAFIRPHVIGAESLRLATDAFTDAELDMHARLRGEGTT